MAVAFPPLRPAAFFCAVVPPCDELLRRVTFAVGLAALDDVAESILCDQDPQAHLDRIREYGEAGYDRVVVQQVGVEQDRLLDMYAESVLPSFATAGVAGA